MNRTCTSKLVHQRIDWFSSRKQGYVVRLIGNADSVTIDRDGFPVAFAAEDGRIVINFGLLTGREATQAELDRLALALRRGGAGSQMTITAARRQDYGPQVETVAHQVQVSLTGFPTDPSCSVEAICGAWASSCAEDRSVEPLPP